MSTIERNSFISDFASFSQAKKPEHQATLAKMQSQVPEVEEVFSNFGTLIKPAKPQDNLFSGIGWFMKLKCRASIYLDIWWSDERFCIRAIKGKDLTPEYFIHNYKDAFYLSEFTHFVMLKGEHKLANVLETFQALFA